MFLCLTKIVNNETHLFLWLMAGKAGWISGSLLLSDATHLSDAGGEFEGVLLWAAESPVPFCFTGVSAVVNVI